MSVGVPLLMLLLAIISIALFVAAIVSIARSAQRLGQVPTILWVAVVLCFPLLGAIAWFVVGRPTASPAA